jgi:glycosyltransferase involved in cell wall biosynthesis
MPLRTEGVLLPEWRKRHMRIEGGRRLAGCERALRPERPLVSIVTPVFNGEAYLAQTIRSVAEQTYDNIEYIVIDGGSTDGTVDILRDHEDSIDYWVSEKDSGISDAFNKGIFLSRGEFVGIIGADDWYEPDAVETIISMRQSVDFFAFGACTYINDAKAKRTLLKPDKDYGKKIERYMPHLHHPTVFVRRTVYERYGLFSEDYRYAMDYEFLLRLHKAGCVGTPVEKNIAYCRVSGISNRMFREARREAYLISRKYGQSFLRAISYYLAIMFLHRTRALFCR